jgi:hypothetical protein
MVDDPIKWLFAADLCPIFCLFFMFDFQYNAIGIAGTVHVLKNNIQFKQRPHAQFCATYYAGFNWFFVDFNLGRVEPI